MNKDEGMMLLRMLSARPVAYNPDVARIVGSVKAAVFLCQLLYWTGKGKRRDGFIWKTRYDWEEETALSRYEQEGARNKLKELGILEEQLLGVPATLHFRVNQERFLEVAEEFYLDKPSSWGKTPQLDGGKSPNKVGENQPTIPENTTETTTESKLPEPVGSVGSPPTTPETPIGQGLVQYNLDDEFDLLEDTGARKAEITVQCDCGQTLTQTDNACTSCGKFVVWVNSPLWKKTYGDPRAFIRKVQKKDLKPMTPLEVEFCSSFNRKQEFSNVTQRDDFRRIQKAYPDAWIRELIEWATKEGRRKPFSSFISAVKNQGNYEAWKDKEVEKYDGSGEDGLDFSGRDAEYDF